MALMHFTKATFSGNKVSSSGKFMGEVGVSMEAESSMVILVSSGLSPVENSSTGSVFINFLEVVKT